MGPAFWGPVTAAGMNIIGGSLRNEKQVDPTTSAAYWDQKAEARKFARSQIQWRVNDARKAGVHPLFALGANMAGYSPSASIGSSESDGIGEAVGLAGQDISRAIAAQKTQEEKDEASARLKLLEAGTERDLAQAQYYRAQAAKLEAPGTAAAPFGNDVVVGAYKAPEKIESHPLYQDAVKLKPDEMESRSATHLGETAGRDHPGMRQFQFPGGFQMLLPATGGGGIPEEIDASMLPLVIGANIQRYGYKWIIDAANYVTGASPDETKASGEKWKGIIRRWFSRPEASEWLRWR